MSTKQVSLNISQDVLLAVRQTTRGMAKDVEYLGILYGINTRRY